jgi:acetylglutamate kinase
VEVAYPWFDDPEGGTMVEEAIRKADVLIEALGYIREFRHKIIVVKLGGSVLEHEDTLQATLQDLVFMETVGLRPILVHGGGKAISQAMDRAGLEPHFIQGRRYTDEATLEIVADVLSNEINADIVRRLEKLGGWAMGLHHNTTNCLYGEKLELTEDGQVIDLGLVGKVTSIDKNRLLKLCNAGIIPVIPSLAMDRSGGLLNINADTAASAVAELLKAEKLIFVSDMPGILADAKDEHSLLRSLTSEDCYRLIGDGTIRGGMIPKVEACIESLRRGVGKTHMVDGRVRHSLLLEIYTESGVGTEIVLDQ